MKNPKLLAAVAVIATIAVATAIFFAPAGRPLSAPLTNEVELENLTWVEMRARIAAGTTTVIIPTGGTEQNGPHMVLGKHNFIIRETAKRIAAALGDAVVAPVIAYVPEGAIESRQGHMAFAGTISVPGPVFEGVLEATARSMRQHGFRTIVLLGDSGGNQQPQQKVARRLNKKWRATGPRVIAADAYYRANGGRDWLKARGFTDAAIGRHAGIQDTSELLAIYPQGVRAKRALPGGGAASEPTGVDGDPSKATAEIGNKLLQLKVETAVREIRAKQNAGPAQ